MTELERLERIQNAVRIAMNKTEDEYSHLALLHISGLLIDAINQLDCNTNVEDYD